MELWVPLTLGCVIVVAHVYIYQLTVVETKGAASIGLTNAAGLVLVFLGIVAAGLILRRAGPLA